MRHRPRRARLLHHRRQRRHQCRRQPGAALRHGAQERARARGGAGRRPRRALAQQDDEEQRGLRLDADVHRLGRARSASITRVVLGLHARPQDIQTAVLAVDGTADAIDGAARRRARRCPAGCSSSRRCGASSTASPRPRSACRPPSSAAMTSISSSRPRPARRASRSSRISWPSCTRRAWSRTRSSPSPAPSATGSGRCARASTSTASSCRKAVGFDVSDPARTACPRPSTRCGATCRRWREGIVWVVFGHIADSNLHVNVMPPQYSHGDQARHRAARLRPHRLARRVGLGRARHRPHEAALSRR